MEVQKVQEFTENNYSHKLSKRAAVVFLKWISQERFIKKLNKEKHKETREKLEKISDLTKASTESLFTKVSRSSTKKSRNQKKK